MEDDIAGAATQVEHRTPARRCEPCDRALAPALIHTRGEHAICGIVARSNAREHLAHERALVTGRGNGYLGRYESLGSSPLAMAHLCRDGSADDDIEFDRGAPFAAGE